MRFWIICFCQVMVVCLLVTDIFNLSAASYTFRRSIMLGAWTLRSIVLILVCIYFFRRSRKLVLPDDAVRIRKIQYVSWGAWGCAYLALFIAGVTETHVQADFVTCSNLDVIVCESVIPILFDTLGLGIYITMAGIAFMIKRAMQRAQRHQQTLVSRRSETLADVRSQVMEKALFFIYIMIGVSFYVMVNNTCIYIFYTDLCLPNKIPIEVDSLIHLINTIVTFYLWLFPLYRYFWPSMRQKKRDASYKMAVYMSRSHFSTDNILETDSRNTISQFMTTTNEHRQNSGQTTLHMLYNTSNSTIQED